MELNPPLITEAELQAELAAIEAESIGWLPLGDGVYLHVALLHKSADRGGSRNLNSRDKWIFRATAA